MELPHTGRDTDTNEHSFITQTYKITPGYDRYHLSRQSRPVFIARRVGMKYQGRNTRWSRLACWLTIA